MENLGEYVQEETPNTRIRQFPREPMLEEVTANSSELLQTVKDLKTEMELVKRENERILKAQEELNQILKKSSKLKEGAEDQNLRMLVIK